MSSARITWNSNNLDLEELSAYNAVPAQREAVHTADGAVTERVRTAVMYEVEVGIEDMDRPDLGGGLLAWWEWACQGKAYSFAADAARMVQTTLAAAASAGATTLKPTDLTGIVVDGVYLLRSGDRQREERVRVQLINLISGQVQLYRAIRYNWNLGEVFRDHRYWPSVVTRDSERPWTENPGRTVSFLHRFVEEAA